MTVAPAPLGTRQGRPRSPLWRLQTLGWAFASALLHGAVVAGLLIWPDRTTPPLPPEEIGVALIFADAETGAPTTNLPDAPPGEAAMAAAQPPTNTPSTALPDPSSVPEDARAPAEHRSDDSAAARDLAGQVALPAAAAELPNLPLPPPAPPPSAATSAMANLPLPPPAPQPPPVRLAARAPVADRPAGGAAARLEDGGRATGAVVPASIATGADNRPPEYPFDSRRKGEEGVVGLRVHVAEDGSVVDVELAQSSGFPLLDDAAERAVRSWRFRPALRDGVPVRSTLRTAVQFRLQDAR